MLKDLKEPNLGLGLSPAGLFGGALRSLQLELGKTSCLLRLCPIQLLTRGVDPIRIGYTILGRVDLGEHSHAARQREATTGGGCVRDRRCSVTERLGQISARAVRIYDQAADIVEGIMVNVPSREAQARLVSVTSELYTGHFRLAADGLKDSVKAYEIIERARGRTAADVLRALPDDNPVESQAAAAQAGVCSSVASAAAAPLPFRRPLKLRLPPPALLQEMVRCNSGTSQSVSP